MVFFQFFRRKKSLPTQRDFGFLKTDMHSHLIPGIDDGADTMETSLALLQGLVDMGYQRVIATPHVKPYYFPNEESDIKRRLTELRKAAKAKKIKVQIDCAAEYHIDHTFGEKIESGKMLTFSGNHVLIELSTIAPPPNLEAFIFEMRLKGYQPVMAHPERYIYLGGIKAFQKMKDYGCLLQLNLLSLNGHYGKEVKELATNLLKAGMVDLLGTDMHHRRHLELLQKMAANRSVMKLISQKPYMNAAL